MRILWAIILSFLVCQTIKMFAHWIYHHRLNFWIVFEDGGMPSTYSTVLLALVTSLFYETGFSNIFIVAAVITIMALNESMKVKRQQGIHSELMVRFVDLREVLRRKLTESLGHTPEQVVAGAILGFGIASLLYIF